MRKVLLPLAVCGLVFNMTVVAALYVRDPSYGEKVFWLSFLPAFLIFVSAMFLLNGRRLGRMEFDQLSNTLVALPIWVRAGLGLLFVITTVTTIRSQTGTRTDLGFDREFATIATWISAAGTALHYGMLRGRKPGA